MTNELRQYRLILFPHPDRPHFISQETGLAVEGDITFHLEYDPSHITLETHALRVLMDCMRTAE